MMRLVFVVGGLLFVAGGFWMLAHSRTSLDLCAALLCWLIASVNVATGFLLQALGNVKVNVGIRPVKREALESAK